MRSPARIRAPPTGGMAPNRGQGHGCGVAAAWHLRRVSAGLAGAAQRCGRRVHPVGWFRPIVEWAGRHGMGMCPWAEAGARGSQVLASMATRVAADLAARALAVEEPSRGMVAPMREQARTTREVIVGSL